MDLELTDEQAWLQEAVDTLLQRAWPPIENAADAGDAERGRVWSDLGAFGAFADGDDALGAVDLCLIARALGHTLASVPFLGTAAVRLALGGSHDLPARFALAGSDGDAVGLALLEQGAGWDAPPCEVTLTRCADGNWALHGAKVAVELPAPSRLLLVSAATAEGPALVLVDAQDPAVDVESQQSFDPGLATCRVVFDDVPVASADALTGPAAADALQRLQVLGGLLACAEAVGAATRIAGEARSYATQRRQFGQTIGSFQAIRHILAEMYVRHASSWSTVLYAAAAWDDGEPDAAWNASIAKAYVARGARDVAHGAIQVFGGVAITAEHPAHRFLRRIVVRERQFGDAAHHEARLGETLAERAHTARGAARMVSA